jgi:RNA polymerase sigma factor (sigma-70 family)
LVADDDLLAQFEQTFHIDQITQTLGHLDFQTQDILLLKFGEGRSYEEIAPLVGLQPDNVRQKAFRGLKKLKQLLSQLSEER